MGSDEVRNIKLLIAFSSQMEETVEKLQQLSNLQGIFLEASYKVTKRGLLTDDRLKTSDCLLIQEYLDETEPITVEYLRNFDVFNNLRIICVFSEKQREDYAGILYANGFYDCLFENDATYANLVDLFGQGRNKKQAQIYYGIKENTSLDVFLGDIEGLDEFISFIKLHKNDTGVIREKFNEFTVNFSDSQIRLLVTELPAEISEQLLQLERYKRQYDDIKERISSEDTNIKAGKIKTVIKEKQVVNETIKYVIPVTGAKNIGVCSLSSGAGSSFITMNLAAALSDYMNVSVVEPPIYTPYIYDTLGIRGYLEDFDRSFYPFAHYIDEDKNIEYNKEFKYNDISWIVTDPDRQVVTDWNYYKMIKLMYVSKQSLLSIIDIGTYINHDSIKGIKEQFDMFLVVIDPFVTQYMNNFNSLLEFKKMKAEGMNVEFIINKFNSGVDKKRLLNYLDIKPIEYVPFIKPEFTYKASYECVIPYEFKEVREELEPAFSELVKKLVPEEIIKSNGNKTSRRKLGFFKWK